MLCLILTVFIYLAVLLEVGHIDGLLQTLPTPHLAHSQDVLPYLGVHVYLNVLLGFSSRVSCAGFIVQ